MGVEDVIYQKKHIPVSRTKFDVELFLLNRETVHANILRRLLRKHKALKFDVKVVVKLQKLQDHHTMIFSSPCFRAPNQTILSPGEIREALARSKESLLDAYDAYMKEGSGWTLSHVEFSELTGYKLRVGGGGGGHKAHLLPKKFANLSNRSILTLPPTNDHRCFLYCVLAGLYPPKGNMTQRTDPRHYVLSGKINKVNIKGLTFPTPLHQVPLFEAKNNLRINVFGLDDKDHPYFLHKSRRTTGKNLNLLLYRKHFHLIRNWAPFGSSTTPRSRRVCFTCGKLALSSSMDTPEKCRNCEGPSDCCLAFTRKGEVQKFKNFSNTQFSPFVFYCDLETALCEYEEPDHQSRKVKKKKIHRATAIGLLRTSHIASMCHPHPKIFTGPDCIEQFYNQIKEEINEIRSFMSKTDHPINMDQNDRQAFRESKTCYVCGVNFTKQQKKMRDHDHLIAKHNYRGAICNTCNLNRTDSRLKIPMFFHNGGRFDMHFLIQKLNTLLPSSGVTLIAKTAENIMSMELFGKQLVILDSFNHLSSSLATLVDQLKRSGKELKHTKNGVNGDLTALEMMSRKGVFPYDRVTSFDVLESCKSLPPISYFYDSLREQGVSQEDYNYAQKVWNYFSCKNLGDYMKLYLSTDITLLADVMENYRGFFFKTFGLDPVHYISLPGLSYDCMLKYTGVKIDLIHDIETYSFVKKSLRGGVSMIPHRAAYANNPLVPEQFDPKKPISHLIYIDCNSLYSSIMTKKLPTRNLKWRRPDLDWVKEKVRTYKPTDDRGYLIECDLTYPPRIHDLTADLPLAPHHLKITQDMLSPHCQSLRHKLGIKMDYGKKLVSTQFDKTQYVCHVENLQFYLKKGMVLTKVHKVLQFEQTAIFKPYIELCIERRKAAKTPDEKQLWKLACNSIFGKTITNLEKRNNVRILGSEKKLLSAVACRRFKHADIIGKRIVQVTSYKKRNLITSPYFIGATILELSKLHLMQIHYEHFVKKYGIFRLKLCMTDTDSLLYLIETEDIHKDLREMQIMDFSNYPPSSQYYDASREGELFLMKDEAGGTPIKSFIGLRAKSYSLLFQDNTSKVTGKGVPKHKLLGITHGDLERTLTDACISEVESKHMRSYKHQVYTISQRKVALSPFDNKRYIKSDGVSTLPLGHIDTLKHVQGET